MRKLLLFTALLSTLLFPQALKEFDVKPTENRGQIPIFRDFPDKAAMVFYTKFANLMFSSSYGIYKELGDPGGGKYIIIIEPTRQTIEVRGSGYKTEQIKVSDIQQRDVLYYEVLPKKDEGIAGVSEVGITIQVTPSDATIQLDGKSFPNNVTTKVAIGVHSLRVEKPGYGTSIQEITVTPEKTFFAVNLEKVSLSPVTIKSNPSNATVYLNNEQKGTTELGFFLYSGSYDLRIELSEYLPLNETIQVVPTTDKSKNIFSFNLIKNKGILDLDITPSSAMVKINGETRNIYGPIELTPGIYDLEVLANQYDSYREKIEIIRGETLKKFVNLTKNSGSLVINMEPASAVVSINKEMRTGKRFELIPGVYEVEIGADTYYPETFTVSIEKGKIVEKNITLKQKTGALQFTIKPLNAQVTLSRSGMKRYEWEGINLMESIIEGVYDLTAKAQGYKTYSGKLTIRESQTTVEDIKMTEGSDIPDGMVWVKGGTFTIGSNKGDSDEQPVHYVTVNDFFIGKTEVTQQQWVSVMGSNPSYYEGVNRPVEQVSWADVIVFCNEMSRKEGLQKVYSGTGDKIVCNFNANGYRLPTEAEWEYAARGGASSRNTDYSGSNNIYDVAWIIGNSKGETQDVGMKRPNELGIFDMNGNVWEWCWDWYGESYDAQNTSSGGPSVGISRTRRGGSCHSSAIDCYITNRDSYMPYSKDSSNGFRLARSKK